MEEEEEVFKSSSVYGGCSIILKRRRQVYRGAFIFAFDVRTISKITGMPNLESERCHLSNIKSMQLLSLFKDSLETQPSCHLFKDNEKFSFPTAKTLLSSIIFDMILYEPLYPIDCCSLVSTLYLRK